MIQTPCLGAVRAPWAYALGWDSLGEGVPRLRCLGLPPVKTQYIIQSLSQKLSFFFFFFFLNITYNSEEDAKALSGKTIQ